MNKLEHVYQLRQRMKANGIPSDHPEMVEVEELFNHLMDRAIQKLSGNERFIGDLKTVLYKNLENKEK